jgi:hypothetical protein
MPLLTSKLVKVPNGHKYNTVNVKISSRVLKTHNYMLILKWIEKLIHGKNADARLTGTPHSSIYKQHPQQLAFISIALITGNSQKPAISSLFTLSSHPCKALSLPSLSFLQPPVSIYSS